MDCYRCGQEGHRRNDCPERWPAPAASQPSASAVNNQVKTVPARYDLAPPTPVYLQARSGLGMPSHTPYLQVECPWCGAKPLAQCVNRGTSLPRPPHDARAEAAGLPPADRELRAMASEQATESRAARFVT